MKHYLLFFVFFFCFAHAVPAQKVGLVMSGGGAKGMVHLGVIKALEENDIPLDYITGTSIGAIVGGMYASGFTIDEIIEYILSEDFQRWSTGNFEEEVPFFYKKLYPDAEMLSLKANVDKKFTLSLPTNLVPPYQMDFAIMGVFAKVTALINNDLDSLMIPFRALSTDAYDKRQYAPRYGDLGLLVRASMSFPGIFKPTKIDSMILFDGGIINNFPVDVLIRDFDPDFIIGSNCSYNYERPREDDVISHLTALASSTTSYTIPANRGVLVNFDSLTVDLMDFGQICELVEIGYHKTMQQMPEIKERIQRRKTQKELLAQRENFISRQPSLMFSKIDIEGGTPELQAYIKNRMTREKETSVSLPELKSRYFDIVSDGGVVTFMPTARYEPSDSSFTLHLRITPAPNLKFALGGYVSSVSNQGFISVLYSHYSPFALRGQANFYFGSTYNSQKILLRTDYRIKKWNFPIFQEAGATHNVFDYYSRNPDLIYKDTRPDFMKEDETFGFLNFGTTSVFDGVARLGVTAGAQESQYYQTKDFLSNDIPEKMKFSFVAGKFSLETNSLNFRTLATRGIQQKLVINYIYGEEHHVYGTTAPEYVVDSTLRNRFINSHHFWRIKMMRTQHFQLGKHFSLGYLAEGVFAQEANLIDYYASLLMLPAFEPLNNTRGLFLENFRSNIYVAAGIIPAYIFFEKFLLRGEVYAFQAFTKLSQDNTHSKPMFVSPTYKKEIRNIFFMGATSLVYQTAIGNFSGTLAYYDRQSPSSKWFFSVNFGYYLHNRRAFE